MFEAFRRDHKDERNKPLYVIKDCWVEDQEGKRMGHEIIEEVREAIGDKFTEHFVNFCGYRKTTSKPLERFCQVLTSKEFKVGRAEKTPSRVSSYHLSSKPPNLAKILSLTKPLISARLQSWLILRGYHILVSGIRLSTRREGIRSFA